jgi:glycosyltransferase involved in cell wall biosynthesis
VRKRVLATAYDVNPFKGSESGTGWNFAYQLSLYNHVTLVTRKNNRQEIERYIKQYKINCDNLKFEYFDLNKFILKFKKGQFISFIYFNLWQLFLPMKYFKRRADFDVVHSINFHADHVPTFLWLLNKPLIWGPLSHNEAIPREILQNNIAILKDRLVLLIKRIRWNFDPFLRLSVAKSTIILGSRIQVKSRLRIDDKKFRFLSTISSDLIENKSFQKKKLEILFVGRLVKIKAIHIAVLAFNDFLQKNKNTNARFTIIGGGPETDNIKKLINKLNIKRNVELISWIDKSELFNYYSRSSLFIFPSYEGGGAVVAEALSHSLPVILNSNGGAAEIVNDSCSIRINHSKDINTMIYDYSYAINQILLSENYANYALNSRLIFEREIQWGAKGKKLKEIYKSVKS